VLLHVGAILSRSFTEAEPVGVTISRHSSTGVAWYLGLADVEVTLDRGTSPQGGAVEVLEALAALALLTISTLAAQRVMLRGEAARGILVASPLPMAQVMLPALDTLRLPFMALHGGEGALGEMRKVWLVVVAETGKAVRVMPGLQSGVGTTTSTRLMLDWVTVGQATLLRSAPLLPC